MNEQSTAEEIKSLIAQRGIRGVTTRSQTQNGRRVYVVDAIGPRGFSRQRHRVLHVAMLAAIEEASC